MSGPSTSSERSTVGTNNHGHHPQQQVHQQMHSVVHNQVHNQHELGRQPDYNQAAVAVAAASGMMGPAHPDDGGQFHPHQHHYNAAAHFQQQQVQQAQQAQLQQYQLLQQQQMQQHQQMQPQHHHLPPQMAPMPQHGMHQQAMHAVVGPGPEADYEGNEYLTSKFMENEIIKTFPSKPELVKYVKNVLNDEEQCKIVINSSKPKAVYFQCERSGSFRTTVKDSTKRQRVAYTKRNKCGFRLVANLYPPEKDKKRTKRDEDGIDKEIDDKLNEFQHQNPMAASNTNEIWILRMIHPQHNHAPEPNVNAANKKKRSKYTRTLVEKPLNRGSSNPVNNFNPNDIVASHPHQQAHVSHPPIHQHPHPHHHHDPSHTPSVQDPAVIAAMEATPNTDATEAAVAAAAAAAIHHQHPQVDPNIDPNVDPSVQEHDHSHGTLR